MKTHSTESGFVVGPSSIQFRGVYVCTFHPGNFTGCGSEGVIMTKHNPQICGGKPLFQATKQHLKLNHTWNSEKLNVGYLISFWFVCCLWFCSLEKRAYTQNSHVFCHNRVLFNLLCVCWILF